MCLVRAGPESPLVNSLTVKRSTERVRVPSLAKLYEGLCTRIIAAVTLKVRRNAAIKVTNAVSQTGMRRA